MTPAELVARIEAGQNPLVLDVRSRFEFDRGHVPGARHVSFWRTASHLAAIKVSPPAEVVIYCGHGPRALWTAWGLRLAGVTRVSLLEGHWARWVREGLPRESATGGNL